MLKLATIFTDHMVLQANKPIKIFGEGAGSAKIEFLGKSYDAYGAGDSWCVTIEPQPYGGPYEMSFESEGVKIDLHDIYIGEVWLASGQSNMEMPLFRVDGGLTEAKHADNKLIRFFTVPRQFKKGLDIYGSHFFAIHSTDTPWRVCDEYNALRTSAVGYIAVKEIQERLGCAVGLIECNWGARWIETFIDKKYFYEYDFLRPVIEEYNEMLAGLDREAYEEKIAEHVKIREREVAKSLDAVEMVKERGVCASVWMPERQVNIPELPLGPYSLDAPGTLFDSMLSKIIPYGMQGVLWYQGESNVAKDYAKKYLVFMKCLRESFENAELSFYATELAPFEYNGIDDEFVTEPNNWGFKREQQMLATKVDSRSHLVTTQHLGDEFDIHPRAKIELGHRMALKMLKHTYGFDILADQPTYKSASFERNRVTLTFDNADGLYTQFMWVVKFYVADEEHNMERAEVEIMDDGRIILYCKMEKPCAVRFAFQMHYNGMAPFNVAGLPLSPFRTDGYDELLCELKSFAENELN